MLYPQEGEKIAKIKLKPGAFQVEHPRCEWEIAVIEIAKKRLAGHPFANNLFIDIISTALFKDASIIMTEYIPYGTLLVCYFVFIYFLRARK